LVAFGIGLFVVFGASRGLVVAFGTSSGLVVAFGSGLVVAFGSGLVVVVCFGSGQSGGRLVVVFCIGTGQCGGRLAVPGGWRRSFILLVHRRQEQEHTRVAIHDATPTKKSTNELIARDGRLVAAVESPSRVIVVVVLDFNW